jgi:hypothetical protein
MTTFTTEDRENYESHPMYSIYDSSGKLYLSVVDAGVIAKIQLHRYDKDFTRGLFLDIDKRAIPELIETLKKLS